MNLIIISYPLLEQQHPGTASRDDTRIRLTPVTRKQHARTTTRRPMTLMVDATAADIAMATYHVNDEVCP